MANPILAMLEGNGSLAGRDRAGAFTATGSGALRYAAANGARINLIKDPLPSSVGSYISEGGGNTVTFDAAVVTPIGTGALDCSGSSIDYAMPSLPAALGNYGKIASANQHRISFWSYGVSGDTDWKVSMLERNGAGSTVSSAANTAFTTVIGQWTRHTAAYTLTGTGTDFISFKIYRGSATAGRAYFCGFVLEDATVSGAGTWFTPTVWLNPITGVLGTANASPSVSRATFWIEEATTNTVPDPSFEAATITTNWTANGSATISKVTTHVYLGSNAGKCSCTASTSDAIRQINTSGAAAADGQTWTVSARVRAFASGDVGKTVKLGITERTSANVTVVDNASEAFTLTDAWQLISYTVTLSGGGTVAKVTCSVWNAAATAVDFVVDCVQLEQKAYATSYCDGTLGTGYSWSGTAHASTSSRTAATDSSATTNRINIPAGSALFRYLRSVDTSTEEIYGEVGTKGASTDHVRWGVDSSDRAFVEWSSNNAAYQRTTRTGSLAIATKYLWYIDWSGTVVNIALGTESLTSGTRAATSGSWGAGDIVLEGAPGGQYVGPVAIYDRPLTAAERAKVNAAIDSNGAASLWTVLGSNAYRNFQLRPVSQ